MPLRDILLWTGIVALLSSLSRLYWAALVLVWSLLLPVFLLLYRPRFKSRAKAFAFWAIFTFTLVPAYITSVGPYIVFESAVAEFMSENPTRFRQDVRRVRNRVYPVSRFVRYLPVPACHMISGAWSGYLREWENYSDAIFYPLPP